MIADAFYQPPFNTNALDMCGIITTRGVLFMRDCDHCQLMRNNTCGGLECHGFKPVGSIDPEILKNAADHVDADRHNRSKHSSRRVQDAEERIRNARNLNSQTSKPSILERKVVKGQVLWYKDKHTGLVRSGVVRAAGTEHMLYRYGDREVWLDYNVIGVRLFLTAEDAERYGKLKT